MCEGASQKEQLGLPSRKRQDGNETWRKLESTRTWEGEGRSRCAWQFRGPSDTWSWIQMSQGWAQQRRLINMMKKDQDPVPGIERSWVFTHSGMGTPYKIKKAEQGLNECGFDREQSTTIERERTCFHQGNTPCRFSNPRWSAINTPQATLNGLSRLCIYICIIAIKEEMVLNLKGAWKGVLKMREKWK